MEDQVNSMYFSRQELACRHTGRCEMDPAFMRMLDKLRDEYALPMVVSSGFRDPSHPSEAGKAAPGWHTKGRAVDILVHGAHAHRLVKLALLHGFTGIGISQRGAHEGRFIHLDNRELATIWSY